MITQDFRRLLEKENIKCHTSNENLHLLSNTTIEAPFEFRSGRYDVEHFGAFSYIGGDNTFVRHVKSIGRYCSIAANFYTGAVEHDPYSLSAHPLFNGGWTKWDELDEFYSDNAKYIEKTKRNWIKHEKENFGKIVIGNNVWIGEGVFIRRGVTIGDGAIIASRSSVVKDVEPYTIVGGTPAKHIKYRYSEGVIEDLKHARWWEYEHALLRGIEFANIEKSASKLRKRIESGKYKKYEPKLVHITAREQSLSVS